jgi:hypothetical protein
MSTAFRFMINWMDRYHFSAHIEGVAVSCRQYADPYHVFAPTDG